MSLISKANIPCSHESLIIKTGDGLTKLIPIPISSYVAEAIVSLSTAVAVNWGQVLDQMT